VTFRIVRTKRRDSQAGANTFTARQILDAFHEKFSIPRLESCSSCGSTLVQRQPRLSIYESNEGVTIFVGFCEWCDGLPVIPVPAQ
jgi:hypothetical protein